MSYFIVRGEILELMFLDGEEDSFYLTVLDHRDSIHDYMNYAWNFFYRGEEALDVLDLLAEGMDVTFLCENYDDEPGMPDNRSPWVSWQVMDIEVHG